MWLFRYGTGELGAALSSGAWVPQECMTTVQPEEILTGWTYLGTFDARAGDAAEGMRWEDIDGWVKAGRQ